MCDALTADSSSDMWMLRGYNGGCYHAGSTVKTISKVSVYEYVELEVTVVVCHACLSVCYDDCDG